MSEVLSQVLQQVIKQLHKGWEYFQHRGFGFPRFKKYGQLKSLLFPQFPENPATNLHVKLPKIRAIPVNLHRAISNGFAVKQVILTRKADRWHTSVSLQCDVSVPKPTPLGRLIGDFCGVSEWRW